MPCSNVIQLCWPLPAYQTNQGSEEAVIKPTDSRFAGFSLSQVSPASISYLIIHGTVEAAPHVLHVILPSGNAVAGYACTRHADIEILWRIPEEELSQHRIQGEQ
jgi:hypothetical protein